MSYTENIYSHNMDRFKDQVGISSTSESTSASYQENIRFKIEVTDADGSAIEGASVMIEESSANTEKMTGSDGVVILELTKCYEGRCLFVSKAGFRSYCNDIRLRSQKKLVLNFAQSGIIHKSVTSQEKK